MGVRKCYFCKEILSNTDETVPYKGRLSHSKCFDAFMKGLTVYKQEELQKKAEEKKETKSRRKPKQELKDGLSEEEFKDKTKVVNYLKTLLTLKSTDKLPTNIYAIMSNYMNKYELTYDGIYQTLEYLYDIKGREVTDDPLGLVPYLSKMYKEKIVYIQPKKREIKQLSFD